MKDKNACELSCGAVVFHKFEDEYKVLLINFLHSNLNFWGFPKGHMEKDETEIQTAKREIREETGLDVEIIPGFKTSSEYIYQSSVKKVIYFAAETEKTEFEPANEEEKKIAINSKWCNFAEAKSLLTFDIDKSILKQFLNFLKE